MIRLISVNLCLTSPPRSHLGRAHHYFHLGECTVPLCVLAVACTMHNEALQGLTEHYRRVADHYGTVTEKYQFCPSLIEFKLCSSLECPRVLYITLCCPTPPPTKKQICH